MTNNELINTIEEEQKKILLIKSRRVLFLIVMIVAIFLIMGYSFTVGSSSLNAIDAYKILINEIFPGTFPPFEDKYIFIVTELRAPRVLVAALIGAMLAIGGCIMQSILKNPLATPYTLGVSSGAALGASLYFIFGISIISGTAGLIMNTFVFSMIPVAVMLFALTKRFVGPIMLILSGVAFSYMFSSVNSIMQYFGDDSAIANVVFWTMGDLTHASMWMIPILVVALVIYLIFVMFAGKDMDIMRMGDDSATSLGVNIKAVRGTALIVSCFMTALAVAFTGPIGFICLMAPHISRKLVGSDMRWLTPTSACTGAILLLVADMISKTLLAPIMLPVGAITALIGAPVMIYMLYSKRGFAK